MSDDTSKAEKLKEKLVFKKESTWKSIDKDKAFEFADSYKDFLDSAKTEREAFNYILERVEEKGYKNLEDVSKIESGDKVYAVNKKKQIVAAKIGENFDDVRVTLSHLDAPRLDLKQKSFYEANDLCIADTHYYGGIKKYQWTNVPLAFHGTVVDSENNVHTFVVGEDENDPVFLVPDLLPHLGREQLKKKLKDAIEGEELNILVGNIPIDEEGAEEAVKLNILNYLNEKYGFVEEDMMSAEIEAVPATKSKDMGFDRSMVAAYGQDDRGHAFVSLESLFESESDKTLMACFFDKEEIGSEGNTSIKSGFLERVVSLLIEKSGEKVESGIHGFFNNVDALSMDVSAAVNPNHAEMHDAKNSLNLGQGVAFVKFTGAGGKYSANDANAEFVGRVRKWFNDEEVPFHPVELGKVDKGGGGTVAKFLANRGSDVVDMGFPLLSMHSPYEIASKADIYSTFKAGKAFYEGE